MIGLVLFLLLGLALAWAACAAYTAWMLVHPPRRTYASAVSRGRPGDPSELPTPREFTTWTFPSRGRALPVWDIAGAREGGPVIILTHGWGDSRIGALSRLDTLAPLASRILAWDLPGHGEAPGTSSLGVHETEDLRALVAAARDTSPEAAIVLYGWSLGAGVSIALAATEPLISGVIAETPYRLARTPARNVLRLRRLPHRFTLTPALWMLRFASGPGRGDAGFDRLPLAARTPPLLVLHGDEDEVSPIEDGRALARAAPGGRIAEIRGAGHNNLWTEPAFARECSAAVSAFIEGLGASAAPRPQNAGAGGDS